MYLRLAWFPGSVVGLPVDMELNRPHGVFVDAQGTRYIADSANHRVLKLQKPIGSKAGA
jgi:hypothetical protein